MKKYILLGFLLILLISGLTSLFYQKSQITQNSGSKKIFTRSNGLEGEAFKEFFVIADTDGSSERVLLIRNFGVDEWVMPTEANWSPDRSYFFLQHLLPDGGDVYVFKADTSNFKNGKTYLLASELGYKQSPISEVIWESDFQLEITSYANAPVNPPSFSKYLIDAVSEKLTTSN